MGFALIVFVLVQAVCIPLSAQSKPKVADKELVGVWLMQSMQWDGQEPYICGKDFVQVKIYGPDGEYTAVSLVKQNNGEIHVMASEYGTYTFKNGVYSECGRAEGPADALVLVDKTTFTGRWMNRSDVWKKNTHFPDNLRDYLVKYSKTAQEAKDYLQKANTKDMQTLIKTHVFN